MKQQVINLRRIMTGWLLSDCYSLRSFQIHLFDQGFKRQKNQI